jgi:hypothetical protein
MRRDLPLRPSTCSSVDIYILLTLICMLAILIL